VSWFNPRTGGALVTGTIASINGGTVPVGRPPTDLSSDWVALLRCTSSSGGTPSTGEILPPATAPSLAVGSLTLVNASTQQDLRTLVNGAGIALSLDGVALNVRANVSGTAGSVRFLLDGVVFRTENVAPYAMAGDDAGVYRKWTPPLGNHTLRVIPYAGSDASGTAGTALEIAFTVTN